jgi:hypothetical protein
MAGRLGLDDADYGAQTAAMHTELAQSRETAHVSPSGHPGQTGPPQSTSVSSPFCTSSVHVAGGLPPALDHAVGGSSGSTSSPHPADAAHVAQPSKTSPIQIRRMTQDRGYPGARAASTPRAA